MREKQLLYHTRRPTSSSPVHSENLDIPGYAKAAQNVPLLLSQVSAWKKPFLPRRRIALILFLVLKARHYVSWFNRACFCLWK